MKSLKKSRGYWLPAVVLAIVLGVFPALAAGPLDPSFQTRLELHFVMDGTPISDLPFTVHKIADWDGTTKFTFNPEYARYEAIDLSGMKGNEQWLAAAATMTGKIQADPGAPSPAGTGKTGSDGIAGFDGMTPGVYLIYSDWTRIGDYKYAAIPYFAVLPALDEKTDSWSKLTVSYPKRQKLPDYKTLKVLKVWDDKGYESRRPSDITVHLLKNGTVAETRKLNAANEWKCTFENLSQDAVYTVTEDSVSGYTTTIKAEGITFVVTNKKKNNSVVVHPVSDGGKTTIGTETEVFNPLLVASGGAEENGLQGENEQFRPNLVLGAAASKLPQTGLLWWPVLVLSILGITLIIVGSIVNKKE